MSVPVVELPPSFQFGKVVGRLIHAIADTAEDADDKPQARAAAGTITFTPRETLRKATDSGLTAIVTQGPVEATLSSSGRILDAEGRQGIWLVTGVWGVSFSLAPLANGGTRPQVAGFDLLVTTAHTDSAPLDLAREAPYVAPTGTVVQTLVVPSGGSDGQALVRASDGSLVWRTVATGGGGAGGVTEHAALTGRDAADAHPISAVTGLTSALAGKQPSGSYVAGNDARLTDARTPVAHQHTVAELSDATAPARALLTAVSHAAQRGLLSAVTAAEVDARIQAVVASAPAALDTLDELAAALGDDANFAATVTNALAGKASTSHTHTASQVTDFATAVRATRHPRVVEVIVLAQGEDPATITPAIPSGTVLLRSGTTQTAP